MRPNRLIKSGFYRSCSLVVVLSACHSSQSRGPAGPLEDFALSSDAAGNRVTTDQYYSDLERSTAAVPFRSSFPLAFSVGGSRSSFERVPAEAHSPLPSRLTIRMAECSIFLSTGPVQVRRFLYTGEWIKFGQEIQPQSVAKLEKQMDLNLKMASQLSIEIPKPHFDQCRRILYGRRTFIGRYHLYHSNASLIADSASSAGSFERAELSQQGQKVYIYWHKDWQVPVLKNDLEFPATVESPIYRAQLGNNGFYYIGFQPVLRMQNVNRLVIQIPLPEQLQKFQQKQIQNQEKLAPDADSKPAGTPVEVNIPKP